MFRKIRKKAVCNFCIKENNRNSTQEDKKREKKKEEKETENERKEKEIKKRAETEIS